MKHRIAIAAGLMIAQLVMSGCVAVVVPMRKRVEGVAHPPVLNFKAGTTKREEVLSALEGLYTGVSGPTYFWARWNESRWGFGGAIGGMSQGAGGAVATRHRLWRQRNLLASFNPDGVVIVHPCRTDHEALKIGRAHV